MKKKITLDSFTKEQAKELKEIMNIETNIYFTNYYHSNYKKFQVFCDETQSWEGAYNYARKHNLINWEL